MEAARNRGCARPSRTGLPEHGLDTVSGMAQLAPADIDLSNHDLFVDHAPHEVFDVLRAQAPVHWNPEPAPRSGFWS